MEDELRRKLQIEIYSRELVRLYGFTGEDAEHERRILYDTLDAGEQVDYDALQVRAQRHVREGELRKALVDSDLTPHEIDRLVSDFIAPPED